MAVAHREDGGAAGMSGRRVAGAVGEREDPGEGALLGVARYPAWGVAFLHTGWRTACSKGLGECPSVFDRFLAKKEWLSFDVNQTFLGLS